MANDFSGDSNCKALWRFESGALTTDAIGSNTLNNSNVTAETQAGYFKEGAASACFDSATSPRLHIADADLDSGFPLKSSESNTSFSLCLWLRLADTSANYILVGKNIYLAPDDESLVFYTRDYGTYYGLRAVKGYNSGNSSETWEILTSLDLQANRWYHIALTWDDTSKEFNCVVWDDTSQAKYTDSVTQTYSIAVTTSPLNLGCRADSDGVTNSELNGWVDEVVFFNDVLSESEIDSIRQGTYDAGSGTHHALGGSVEGVSSATALLQSVALLGGTCTATSHLLAVAGSALALTGAVNVRSVVTGSVRLCPRWPLPAWLNEALFGGMTSNALKLGTTLTGGWFWTRRAGCWAVYRGPNFRQIDLSSVLCVAQADAQDIVLPAHLPHEPDSEYCYLVRRFNGCGQQERTTEAVALVRIDSDGCLAGPVCSGVYGLEARCLLGGKVQLGWFYSPLDQEVAPEVFNVYSDAGTGQLDLENALAVIPCTGRGFYRYLSAALPDGSYRFAVRAGSSGGGLAMSLSCVGVQVRTSGPDGVTFLSAEATT